MNKLLFAIVLAFSVSVCLAVKYDLHNVQSSDSSTTCPSNTSCADKGDDCLGSLSVGGCTYTNGSCCAAGLYCINSTCVTDNIGDPCQNITGCYPSFTASPAQGQAFGCVAGFCQYIYGPGDTCSTSADCFIGLNCSNSVCQGFTQGQACVSGQCAWGLTCVIGICQNDIASGGACPGNGASCIPGTTCINGKCTGVFSLGIGATCHDDVSCDTGLVCDKLNSTCINAATSFTTCTNSSDCGIGELCLCSYSTGNSFCSTINYNPCTDQQSDLISCLAGSNCTSSSDAPNSCAYNNCYSDIKKSNSCGCSGMSTTVGSCGFNPYCGGFPVWAIIVIIVVAIVLVLAIVLLVFFMMRRRRQYDSI